MSALSNTYSYGTILSEVNLESKEGLLTSLAELLYFSGCWRKDELEAVKFEIETDRLRDKRYRQSCYRSFTIPKKSGGSRTIYAPNPRLKALQRAIADILASRFFISSSAHGFAPGLSVKTNAEMHTAHNYVFNTDICHFFPSISGRSVLAALKRCGIPSDTAKFIRDICCFISSDDGDLPEEVLPQGAPSSPFLSNLVCIRMDRCLEGLARRFGLSYSRYADDITFSGDRNVFGEGKEFMEELRRILSDNGFLMNVEKTRLQKRGTRQEVTGLTVNGKVNVGRKYLKNLRAMIFNMEMYGFTRKEMATARGRVAYLGMIRGKDDPAYRKLSARLKRIKYDMDGALNNHWK